MTDTKLFSIDDIMRILDVEEAPEQTEVKQQDTRPYLDFEFEWHLLKSRYLRKCEDALEDAFDRILELEKLLEFKEQHIQLEIDKAVAQIERDYFCDKYKKSVSNQPFRMTFDDDYRNKVEEDSHHNERNHNYRFTSLDGIPKRKKVMLAYEWMVQDGLSFAEISERFGGVPKPETIATYISEAKKHSSILKDTGGASFVAWDKDWKVS